MIRRPPRSTLFPTRRSSDLAAPASRANSCSSAVPGAKAVNSTTSRSTAPAGGDRSSRGARSEEHTSELQSRPHLVCRLLLEKKKKQDDYSSSETLCDVLRVI